MSRLPLSILAVALLAGSAAADYGEAKPLLELAHEEVLTASRPDTENPLEHWKAALRLTEEAHAVLGDDQGLLRTLAGLAERAFMAQEYERADGYARQALAAADEFAESRPHAIGTAVHHANLVLGLLALREDDVEAAGNYLLAAGRAPSTAVLYSFGPNMTLARELLARGKREVVLQYFTLCADFWKVGVERGWLDSWAFEVRSGAIPNFGANLLYGR